MNDGEIIEATREELEGTIIPELARLIDEINNNSFPKEKYIKPTRVFELEDGVGIYRNRRR